MGWKFFPRVTLKYSGVQSNLKYTFYSPLCPEEQVQGHELVDS